MTTVLVGMNNPLSSRPEHALFPHPPGCSGHRLFKMLNAVSGLGRGSYLQLDRRNVLDERHWSPRLARQRGEALRGVLVGHGQAGVARGQWGQPLQVVVLGQAAWAALGLPKAAPLLHPVLVEGVHWRRVPHPSGRSLFYNCPAHRLVVGMLLEEVILDG